MGHLEDAHLLVEYLQLDPEDTNVRSGLRAAYDLAKAEGLEVVERFPHAPPRNPMIVTRY
jgi:hypothetical protein